MCEKHKMKILPNLIRSVVSQREYKKAMKYKKVSFFMIHSRVLRFSVTVNINFDENYTTL
ncbi:hypothetical protein bcgnr5398_38690 [Bacillus cereus]